MAAGGNSREVDHNVLPRAFGDSGETTQQRHLDSPGATSSLLLLGRTLQAESSPDEHSAPKCCSQCNAIKTPMWRNGPDGQKSLCNACGVRLQRAQHKARQRAHYATSDGGIEDQAQVAPESPTMGSSNPRRNSLKGRGSQSLGSVSELCEDPSAQDTALPSPQLEALSRQVQGTSAATAAQKRKPRERSQAVSPTGLVRKRSCVRLPSGDLPQQRTKILGSVEGLDLILADALALSNGSHSITPVRAILCTNPSARAGQSPFALNVVSPDKLLVVATSAQCAARLGYTCPKTNVFTWDSGLNWSLLAAHDDLAEKLNRLLNLWREHLYWYMNAIDRIYRRARAASASTLQPLHRVLGRSRSDVGLRSDWGQGEPAGMPPSSAAAPSGSAEPGASEASDQDQLQEHSQGSSLMTDPSRSHGALLPPLPETLQHSSGWPWSPSAASTGLPAPLLSGIVEPHLPGPSLMLRSSDSGSFELMHQLANSQLLGEGGGLLGEAGLEGLDPLHPSVLAAIHDPGEPGPSEQPRADGTLGLQPPQLPQQQEQQQEQPQQMQMHAEWLLQQLDARAPWPEEGASEGTDQTGSLASAHLVPGLLGALQPKGALGGEECATPPRTGSLGAAQELTARQSSTMGSATRQALRPPSSSSNEGSPPLMHPLSIPRGSFSQPMLPGNCMEGGRAAGSLPAPTSSGLFMGGNGLLQRRQSTDLMPHRDAGLITSEHVTRPFSLLPGADQDLFNPEECHLSSGSILPPLSPGYLPGSPAILPQMSHSALDLYS